MITRIELANFMSHRNTVIEPAPGLTVLVGPNNCGKSAVITALQILAHNENSTYVTRHGEKVCSITVQTDDGHEVIWQRKNASTSYTIDGKLFDRLRNGIPDELNHALRLPKVDLNTSNDQIDIHFGMQKQPVFLLNEPGRTAAGFFAASSDASRLIEMQKVHKERVRSKKQDAKRLESESEALQDEVDKLQTVGELAQLLKQCENHKLQLASVEQKTQQLKSQITKLHSLAAELNRCQNLKQEFESLPIVPQLDPTELLGNILVKIELLRERNRILSTLEQTTAHLSRPPVIHDTQAINNKLNEIRLVIQRQKRAELEFELLNALPPAPELPNLTAGKKLCGDSVALGRRMSKLDSETRELSARMDAVEIDIQQFVESNATCPTCLQPLDKENVVRHLKSAGDCHEA